jgi:hypothetical protein
MPRTWTEVTQQETFQQLPTEGKLAVRDHFFDSVVAPTIPSNSLDRARDIFVTRTGLEDEAVQPEPLPVAVTEETFQPVEEPLPIDTPRKFNFGTQFPATGEDTGRLSEPTPTQSITGISQEEQQVLDDATQIRAGQLTASEQGFIDQVSAEGISYAQFKALPTRVQQFVTNLPYDRPRGDDLPPEDAEMFAFIEGIESTAGDYLFANLARGVIPLGDKPTLKHPTPGQEFAGDVLHMTGAAIFMAATRKITGLDTFKVQAGSRLSRAVPFVPNKVIEAIGRHGIPVGIWNGIRTSLEAGQEQGAAPVEMAKQGVAGFEEGVVFGTGVGVGAEFITSLAGNFAGVLPKPVIKRSAAAATGFTLSQLEHPGDFKRAWRQAGVFATVDFLLDNPVKDAQDMFKILGRGMSKTPFATKAQVFESMREASEVARLDKRFPRWYSEQLKKGGKQADFARRIYRDLVAQSAVGDVRAREAAQRQAQRRVATDQAGRRTVSPIDTPTGTKFSPPVTAGDAISTVIIPPPPPKTALPTPQEVITGFRAEIAELHAHPGRGAEATRQEKFELVTFLNKLATKHNRDILPKVREAARALSQGDESTFRKVSEFEIAHVLHNMSGSASMAALQAEQARAAAVAQQAIELAPKLVGSIIPKIEDDGFAPTNDDGEVIAPPPKQESNIYPEQRAEITYDPPPDPTEILDNTQLFIDPDDGLTKSSIPGKPDPLRKFAKPGVLSQREGLLSFFAFDTLINAFNKMGLDQEGKALIQGQLKFEVAFNETKAFLKEARRAWETVDKTPGHVVTGGEKVSKSGVNFFNLLDKYTLDDPPPDLSDNEMEVFVNARFLTDAVLDTVNPARKAVGLPPISNIAGYITHIYDRKLFEDMPEKSLKALNKMVKAGQGKPANHTALRRKLKDEGSEKWREENLIRDPWKALELMARLDLRQAYLIRPMRLWEETKEYYSARNLLPQETIDFMDNFVIPIAILRAPSKGEEAFNSLKTVKGFESFLHKWTGKSSHNMARDISKIMGRGINFLKIWGNIPLVTLNNLQKFQVLAKYPGKHWYDALAPDKKMDDILMNQLFFKAQKGIVPADDGGFSGALSWIERVGYLAYGNSHLNSNSLFAGRVAARAWLDWKKKTLDEAIADGSVKEMIEESINSAATTQYWYHILGMPQVFTSAGKKSVYKLQSWWMMSATVFAPSVLKRLTSGTNHRGEKIPNSWRYGLFRYLAWAWLINKVLRDNYRAKYARSLFPAWIPTELAGINPKAALALGRISVNMMSKSWNIFTDGAVMQDKIRDSQIERDVKTLKGILASTAYKNLLKSIEQGSIEAFILYTQDLDSKGQLGSLFKGKLGKKKILGKRKRKLGSPFAKGLGGSN